MEGYFIKKVVGGHSGEVKRIYLKLDLEKERLIFKNNKEDEAHLKIIPLDQIASVEASGDASILFSMRHVATAEVSGLQFTLEVSLESDFEKVDDKVKLLRAYDSAQQEVPELSSNNARVLRMKGIRNDWVNRLRNKVDSACDGLHLVVKNLEMIHQRYDLFSLSMKSVLGTGMCGDVKLIYRRSDRRPFAMKAVTLCGSDAVRLAALRNEIDVLKSLDHNHIVRLQETFIEPGLCVRLVMELLEGGELYNRLSEAKHFSEKYACKLLKTMLRTFKYLEEMHIVHRDLKLENWMFRNKQNLADPEDANIVLIDFGLAMRYKSTEQKMTKTLGTLYYVSPEVLQREYYGNTCDMWAIGIIGHMLLTGKAPFDGDSDEEIRNKILNEAPPAIVSQQLSGDAQDFVNKMLLKDPKLRLTPATALGHPWIVDEGKQNSQQLTFSEDVVKRLQRFSKFNELKRLTMEVIAFSLDHKEIENLANLFDEMDSNNCGYITVGRMASCLNGKLNEDNVHEIFKALDEEETGKIHVSEFVAGALQSKYHQEECFLRDAFSRMDAGHKGRITLADLKKLLGKHATDERVNKIWEQSGLSQMGCKEELRFADFLAIMRSDGENEIKAYMDRRASQVNVNSKALPISQSECLPSVQDSHLRTKKGLPAHSKASGYIGFMSLLRKRHDSTSSVSSARKPLKTFERFSNLLKRAGSRGRKTSHTQTSLASLHSSSFDSE